MLVDFAFQLFDLDGGGTLSADEIGILVAEVYGVRSASALDKRVAKVLTKLDENVRCNDLYVYAQSSRESLLPSLVFHPAIVDSPQMPSMFAHIASPTVPPFPPSLPPLPSTYLPPPHFYFYRQKDGQVCREEFGQFNRKYPALLFPAYVMQQHLRRATFGESFWARVSSRRRELTGRSTNIFEILSRGGGDEFGGAGAEQEREQQRERRRDEAFDKYAAAKAVTAAGRAKLAKIANEDCPDQVVPFSNGARSADGKLIGSSKLTKAYKEGRRTGTRKNKNADGSNNSEGGSDWGAPAAAKTSSTTMSRAHEAFEARVRARFTPMPSHNFYNTNEGGGTLPTAVPETRRKKGNHGRRRSSGGDDRDDGGAGDGGTKAAGGRGDNGGRVGEEGPVPHHSSLLNMLHFKRQRDEEDETASSFSDGRGDGGGGGVGRSLLEDGLVVEDFDPYDTSHDHDNEVEGMRARSMPSSTSKPRISNLAPRRQGAPSHDAAACEELPGMPGVVIAMPLASSAMASRQRRQKGWAGTGGWTESRRAEAQKRMMDDRNTESRRAEAQKRMMEKYHKKR